ncbi:MAG: class I SAM-dependent RNA methyltransferase [Gracilibacteraceae bacterium]|jgi:23S rRNA (uracil1939-C5)-methyltransferase|nr:class I SAM-dependent RNA methyltransferase [Gracilibacteraceae bacterium]
MEFNLEPELRLLRAERLASDGCAVARAGDGSVVFVPGLLPGETALVAVTERKRKYWRGEARQLVEPAPERQEPRCPLFGRCGGCQLQHLSYPASLYWKRRWVGEALSRIGGLAAEVAPVAAAVSPWNYRNKAVLHWDGANLGFFAPGSRTVTACADCALLSPEMNAALPALRAALAGEKAGPVTLRRGAAGALASSLPGWADVLTVEILGLSFQVALASFLQVNFAQTEILYGIVREWAELSGREEVWDLYSGVGTLALLLAGRAARVTGVEECPRAVKDARANARRNGINNARFLVGQAEKVLSREFAAAHRPDLAVVDPPRAGLAPAVTEALLAAAPRRLIYVSCDAGTLARDAGRLSRFYRLAAVRPVDMFCWCTAVESVALFTRE